MMGAAAKYVLVLLMLLGLFLNPVWPAPVAYELIVADESGAPAERVGGLLDRNLPGVAVSALVPAERYRRYPYFPVAACSGSEYFLVAHGKRLIAFGCVDDSSAAAELGKIRRALRQDLDTLRGTDVVALYDAALQSAAAAEWPQARRYLRAARARQPGDEQLRQRLQRLLDRQP